MGAETKIAWADSTANFWWGCTKARHPDGSPDAACFRCYAEAFDRRWGESHWGPGVPRRVFGDKHWNEPLKWDREAAAAGERRRVFCGSMMDWADPEAPEGAVERMFDVIDRTPHLDWLLLTKHPDLIARLLPGDWTDASGWPRWRNVWLGTTVGDQKGRWRLDHLTRIPAVVRFVSGEPLLEGLDLTPWLWQRCRDCGGSGLVGPSGEACNCARYGTRVGYERSNAIHWVIAGAESGTKARPMNDDWVRSLRDQCVAAGVGFFFKQKVEAGGLRKIETPVLDGRRWVDPPTGIAPRARDRARAEET